MIHYIFAFFIGFIFFDYLKKEIVNYQCKKLKGPSILPIIGNLYTIKDDTHKVLLKYHETYGPVYRVWMGDYFTIVINDLDLIKKVFVENYYNFLNHSDIPSIENISHNFNGLPFNLDKNEWKRRRIIIAGALSKIKLKNVYSAMTNINSQFLKTIKEFSDTKEPFEPHYYSDKLIVDINFKLFFNIDGGYDTTLDTFKKLADSFNNLVLELGTAKLSDYCFILQPFLRKYYHWFNKDRDYIDSFLKREFDLHFESFKPEYIENPRDLMDTMIGKIGENLDRPSLKKEVVEMLFNIFIGAIDTSAGIINWSFIYLANYQEIQEEVYLELKKIACDRPIELADRISTPFLNAFIKEVERIRPVIPLSVPRIGSEDIVIDGIKFPKNCQVIPNLYGIAFSEKYWDNPNEFNPSRFFTKSASSVNYSIFSYGPRACVGQRFAHDMLYLNIGNIIKSFKFSSFDGKPVDDTGVLGLSLKPKHCKLSVQERND